MEKLSGAWEQGYSQNVNRDLTIVLSCEKVVFHLCISEGSNSRVVSIPKLYSCKLHSTKKCLTKWNSENWGVDGHYAGTDTHTHAHTHTHTHIADLEKIKSC